jgi:phosphohistidine swiveling domain-containing protein
LDIGLLCTPAPAYFVVGLSIPILLTALVGVALAGAVALTAGSGLLQSGRSITLAIALVVIVGVTAALDLAWGALARRRRGGRCPTLTDVGLHQVEVPGMGPKARHLATLSTAGFQIPPGWILPVDEDSWRTQSLSHLHRLLLASGHGRFIVRSCFDEEDGPARSYAGLYESHPWDLTETRTALEATVDAVLKSRASPRAAAYRGGDAPKGPTAILVQRRVDHTAHGFAASADVATGLRDRRLVDITSKDAPWSGYLDVVTDEVVGAPSDPALIRRVAALVRRVERHLGTPVEIEWGVERDTLWLYQARPLTALPKTQTWVQGQGLELPWHPLDPLSASFLLGDAAPVDLLRSALEAVGVEPPHRDAITCRQGRLYVEASAAHDLARVVADPTPSGWGGLARRAWQAWSLRDADEAFPTPPADPTALGPSGHLEALEALRIRTLKPLIDQQTQALLVAGLCERVLGDDAPPAAPRTAMDAAVDAVTRGALGPITAARRWLWWRADHPAALLAPRGLDDPTRLADEVSAVSKAPSAASSVPRPWLATLRDRALTLREVLGARLQGVNLQARHHARQLDAHLAERVDGWRPGDIAHVSLRELRTLVSDPLAAQDVLAQLSDRRLRWQTQEAARPPAVWRVDAQGETLSDPTPSPEAVARGAGLGGGAATGVLLVASDETTTDDARGRVLVAETPAARFTPLCLVASAVVMTRAGPLSHLAMVVRERGIPCVLLPELPAAMRAGICVTVDGDRGEVRHAE